MQTKPLKNKAVPYFVPTADCGASMGCPPSVSSNRGRSDLDAIEAELDRLTAIRNENPVLNAGKPERRKFIIAHRLLTDLRDLDGGTPEQWAAVMRKLNEGGT